MNWTIFRPKLRLGLNLLLMAMICSVMSFGQDGPFGIGNATGADGQPKLLVWLDGSTVTSPVNSDVLLWPDKSGNGNDFTAVGATSPILRSGGPQSEPYLEFSKTDNRMVSAAPITFSSNGVTVYYVFRTSDSDYSIFSFAESDANPKKILTREVGGTNSFTIDGTQHNTNQGDLSNNVWRHAGFIWDNASNPTRWHRSNGTGSPELSQNNVLTGANSAGTGTAVIGHVQNLLNGGYITGEEFDGDLAEVVIYDGKLNKSMLRMMNSYFRTKYGVGGTGGWNKLSAPTSYRFGPIGIGRDGGSNTEHVYSSRDGLVLRANPGALTGSYQYFSGAHDTGNNSIVTTNVTGAVEARWSRIWYMRENPLANSAQVLIAFDFGDGINGDFPNVAENYELLYRSGTSGNFAPRTVLEKSIEDDRIVFRVQGSQLNSTGYYTLGTTDQLVSSLDGQVTKTWHAYQTGDWSNPTTWTLDGSSAPFYINPDSEIPAVGDAIVIASGRTVTMDVNNRIHQKLELQGNLDVATSSGHDFGLILGDGLIRCAGSGGVGNFPLGNTSDFADPLTGGSVEFYGSGFTIPNDILVNDLHLNLNSASSEVTLIADLTHNGLFDVERGTFRVNNTANTVREITSNDDVIVSSNGRIRTSTASGQTIHVWNFEGDLINNGGIITFTNRTSPAYTTTETSDWILARFVSQEQNQELLANGVTNLSRLVMNKGNDMTYVLTLSSSNATYFKLLGRCDYNMGGTNYTAESGNNNACALVNGTFEVRENIFIPLHTGSGNHNINNTVMLWVNGGQVSKGAPDVGPGNTQAIVPYGIVKVSEGTLNAYCKSGITTRENGVIQIDGGEINTNQIRTSVLGPDNIGGVIINGGTVNVDGTLPGGTNTNYYTFSLTYPGNLFRMTGGELRVAGPTGKGLIFINSDPEQTSVSGGTIICEVKNTSSTHKLTSTAPLWNLEIERTSTSATNRPVIISGGESFGETVTDQPLYIENNLTISGTNAASLRAYSTNGNDIDVHIQGSLTIQNGGVYDHYDNTTFFDGNANSLLVLPTSTTQTFHNFVVQKSEESRFARIQSGNSSRAMEVQGSFEVLSGSFDNYNRHVSLHGDVVIQRTVGTLTSTGVVLMEGTTPQTISSENGVFHHFRIENALGASLQDGNLTARGNVRLNAGTFNLGSNKFRIEGANGSLTAVSSPGAAKCFVTDGSASAGGLEVIFKSASQGMWFPMGVDDGGTVRYTPAYVRVNGDYVDDGYIRIVPVNTGLATVNADVGGDYLDFFWRVSHSEFDNLPRVSHIFRYDQTDVLFNEANFASGRVLTESPFERQVDSLTVATDHVNISSNWIYFNGELDNGSTYTGTGRTIANADYTAGFEDRFTGKPEVFFSRSTTYNAAWNNFNNWSELGMFSPGDGPFQYHSSTIPNTNLKYPQEGDIAYIGFDPATGKPHVYEAPAGGITATTVAFTPLQDNVGNRLPRYEGSGAANITVLRPTLTVSASSEIEDIGQISGEGAVLLDGDVDLSLTDVGDFLSEDSSIVIVQAGLPLLTMNAFPALVPNLFITSSNNGSNNFAAQISSNIEVRGDLEIAGNANFRLANGSKGDVIVNGDLKLGQYQAVSSGPQLQFDNTGNPRRLEVYGDVFISGANGLISVVSPNTTMPIQFHEMSVFGNIYQNTSGSGTDGLKFFTDDTRDQITLNLKGTGNHIYQNDGGDVPYLGRLIMDKGVSISSSFRFDSDVEIDPTNAIVGKAVELQNGLLKFNHPNIDITLSNGGGAFFIPSTAGLELGEGTVRLNGLNTGIVLDGLIKVTDGDLILGDTPGENNYLEYSAGGTATIELSGGTLSVGSQIRRGLTNTQGVLRYLQDGGTLLLGVLDAQSADRGVFEIVNNGSEFEFTAGTIEFIRGVNSSSTPSLLLEPNLFNVNGSGVIQIGNAASPAGAAIQNFGIKSAIALPALAIDNSSGNDPAVKLYNSPLTITNSLTIDTDADLDCRFLDLTVNGDIDNDGTLTSASGKLTVQHNTVGTISGSGVYDLFDFDKIGSGNTSVSTNLLVNRNFILQDGQMDFGASNLNVKGDANVNGSLLFDIGSEGLLMDGEGSQTLRRNSAGLSDIDILTTDNPSGVEMIPGAGYTFTIGKELRMKRGVFDLKGNLLKIAEAGDIVQVNAFGESNMISTGGAFTNYGVEKIIPANSTEDVFIPLGLDKFMPVRLIFSDIGYTSGATTSTYLFSLNVPQHPVIAEIPNAPDPEVDDVNNVLQMYHTLETSGVGAGLLMDVEFGYDDAYVAVDGPFTEADYIGARVLNNPPNYDVFKYTGAVNEANNIITFPFNNVTSEGINGNYFAGVEISIPDNVPVYTTTRDGDVNEGSGTGVYDNPVPGDGSPNGAVVVISSGDELTLNVDNVNLFKTIINNGATLIIDGTNFHRIGIVEGTGTIRLINVGSLPAGVYNNFFSCSGGRLEYGGNTDFEVLANLPIIREVTFTGAGQRIISNNDIQVCETVNVNGPQIRNDIASTIVVNGDMVITAGSFENMQGNLTVEGDLNLSGGTFSGTTAGVKTIEGDVNQTGGSVAVGSGGSLDLMGDFIRTGGSFDAGSGSAEVRFVGNALQHIDGDFTGTNAFYQVELNNVTGLQPYDDMHVDNELILTSGNIYTGVDSLIRLTSNSTQITPEGGSPDGFIDGPMEWTLGSANTSTSQYRVFPTGSNNRYRPFRLSNRSAARTWTVQYFDTLAKVEPNVVDMLPSDPGAIETVSIQEYWKVNSNTNSATTARVGLSWGENSAVAPAPADYQALQVLVYNEVMDTWDSEGAVGSSFNYDVGTQTGTFLGSAQTSFTERIFTLGSSLAINPLPVSWMKFEGEATEGGNILYWSTSTEINNEKFVLERSIDAQNWLEIGTVDGAGQSISQLDYSFIDYSSPRGRAYYRLRQVDFDGKEEYAPEIVVLERAAYLGSAEGGMVVFPNPNRTGQAQLLFESLKDAIVDVQIINMSGSVVASQTLYVDQQGVSRPFNSDFMPGVYLVLVKNQKELITVKLVVTP